MLHQAAGLIGLITVNLPTGKMQFQYVSKDIEHQNRIIILVFHLFGGFAIDRSDKGRVGKQGVDELGKRLLQVGKREFFENSGERVIAGIFYFLGDNFFSYTTHFWL